MFFTVELAFIVTAVTMLVSYPMAYYIYKAGPKLKTLLLIIVILPKLSNMLVLVYGLQILLANNGWINKALVGLGIIDEPVKLVSRRWIIKDGSGRTQVVEGPGVVGEQPRLGPGESFEYTSACPLRTELGDRGAGASRFG